MNGLKKYEDSGQRGRRRGTKTPVAVAAPATSGVTTFIEPRDGQFCRRVLPIRARRLPLRGQQCRHQE